MMMMMMMMMIMTTMMIKMMVPVMNLVGRYGNAALLMCPSLIQWHMGLIT